MGMANDRYRDWERFLESCQRAYYSYTRGNDAGVVRLCKKHGISACHVVDIALTNRGPKDDFLSPSELLHNTIRDLEKTGLDWAKVTATCSPILNSRTTREWHGGVMRGKTRKLDELFPIPPTKLSDEDGTGAVAVAACISIGMGPRGPGRWTSTAIFWGSTTMVAAEREQLSWS